MRDYAAEELAAIAARGVAVLDLLWVTAKDRDTGVLTSSGFCNEFRTLTVSVKDGRTGSTVSRDFYGVGRAMTIGSISLTSDLTVRSVDIGLPQIDAVTQALVRGTDVRGAPMQLYRVYLDPATRIAVATAKPRFVGYIDGAPIITPPEGGEGSITLNCVSTTRELTRTSSEVRSHESQQRRAPGDDCYKDTAVCGDWTISWGTASTSPISGTGNVDRPTGGHTA